MSFIFLLIGGITNVKKGWACICFLKCSQYCLKYFCCFNFFYPPFINSENKSDIMQISFYCELVSWTGLHCPENSFLLFVEIVKRFPICTSIFFCLLAFMWSVVILRFFFISTISFYQWLKGSAQKYKRKILNFWLNRNFQCLRSYSTISFFVIIVLLSVTFV